MFAVVDDRPTPFMNFFWSVLQKKCLILGEILGWIRDKVIKTRSKLIFTRNLSFCYHLEVFDCEVESSEMVFCTWTTKFYKIRCVWNKINLTKMSIKRPLLSLLRWNPIRNDVKQLLTTIEFMYAIKYPLHKLFWTVFGGKFFKF